MFRPPCGWIDVKDWGMGSLALGFLLRALSAYDLNDTAFRGCWHRLSHVQTDTWVTVFGDMCKAVSCNYARLAENLRTGTHLTARFDNAVALYNGDWCRRDIQEKWISEGPLDIYDAH